MEGPSVLVQLFVLFAAAKILGELFQHFRQPAVVGELLAGVIVGPSVLGWVSGGDVLDLLAQLGVIILLFRVGLDTDLADLRRVGRAAVLVAVIGQLLGLGLGYAVVRGLGHGHQVALFTAAAVMATSVGIAARVLTDYRATRSAAGRVIVGAAVVDDILALGVLALIAGLAVGDVSSLSVTLTMLIVVAFVGVVVLAGPGLTRRLSGLVRVPGIPDSPFLVAVLLTLGLAALSETIGLAAIVGAFLAGLVFEFRKEEVATQIEPVAELLVPFFFAVTGSRLDLGVFVEADTLGLTAAVVAVAVVTKLAAGWLGAWGLGQRSALAVGVGMIPRGEVSLIVATVALGLGVFDASLYAVVVAMAVVTAVLTPPVLGALLRGAQTPGEAERR